MARTILYPTNCAKSVEVTSGIDLVVPAGTSSITLYAVVDPAKQSGEAFDNVMKLFFSDDNGATWASYNKGGGIAQGTAGHAEGAAPGIVPSDNSEYVFIPNDSASVGTEIFRGRPVAGLLCRGTITVLGGNNGGPVEVGLVLVATNQFGEEVPF